MKPMEHSSWKLPNEDQVELMKWIKPCSVILKVLQGKQNFKVRCLVHNRYECRCINRNKRQRHVKCLFCSGCSIKNKIIKDRKKNIRCQTKQSDTSEHKVKMKVKSLSCVNKKFSEENSVNTNMCADETNRTVQDKSNGSASKTLNSHDFSSSKSYEAEERLAAYQCDKLSYVFVDVDSDLVGCDLLFEEDKDICIVKSETLFTDNKDIDYHLVKSVKLERDIEGCDSIENDITVQNLDVPIFNISDNCTSNDRLSLATNNIHPKIKEEMVNDAELSIINESIIDINVHPVSKLEELPDIVKNNMPVLDENCSDELLDNSNKKIETKTVFIVHEPLKTTEAEQREVETNLQLPNEVNTLSWTLQSDLQIKLETDSRDFDATVQEEDYVNDFCVADENMQLNSKNYEMCQNERNENSKLNVDRPYVCEVCSTGFKHLCHLKVHRCLHTGERPFGCTICGKAFIQLDHLTVHKRVHTREKPFACTVCGKVFIQLSSLITHKRIHTGEKVFGCTICGKVFRNLASLTVHKRIHTGEKPFDCTICGKRFAKLACLTTHSCIHTGDKPFGCTICGKVFTTQGTLKIHKHIHTGEKPFCCTICGKTFAKLTYLRVHKRVHTGEKPFGCSVCGKVFSILSSLTTHKRIHTGEKPFGCTTCGKAFTHLVSLTVHKRLHTGEKPFDCTICGKTFTQLAHLSTHKRIHTGEKPFGCTVCGKAFAQPSHLTIHKRIHTGEKSFVCTICGKVFTQLSNLTIHKRIHTGEKPFGCCICGKVFTQRANLTVHKRVHTRQRLYY